MKIPSTQLFHLLSTTGLHMFLPLSIPPPSSPIFISRLCEAEKIARQMWLNCGPHYLSRKFSGFRCPLLFFSRGTVLFRTFCLHFYFSLRYFLLKKNLNCILPMSDCQCLCQLHKGYHWSHAHHAKMLVTRLLSAIKCGQRKLTFISMYLPWIAPNEPLFF